MANTFIFDDEDQPDDMGSPLPDQDDDDQAPEEGEEGNNRLFIMALIGIGVLAFVSVLCIVGFLFLRQSGLNKDNLAATDTFATAQVLAALQETQTAAAATPTLASIAMTETPTPTSVLVIFATDTPSNLEPTDDPATSTFEALQTQLAKAQAQTTATFVAKNTPAGPGTRTATPQIPKTGFADEVGLPALVIVTMILLGIILLARRLRGASAR